MAGLEPIGAPTETWEREPSVLSERRKSARYTPRMDRGHFGWWEGGQFRSLPTRLLNLSLEGAAVLLPGTLPGETSVLVSIVGVEWAGWIPASVLGSLESDADGRVVRLLFRAPLAYEVFRITVWGFPDDHPLPQIPALFSRKPLGALRR